MRFFILHIIFILVICLRNPCLSCKLGFSCQHDPPMKCPKGTVSFDSTGECINCAAGQYNDQEGGIYYWRSNLFVNYCKTCPLGYYCPTPDATPIPCPHGYVNSLSDRTVCVKCKLGTYTLGEGSIQTSNGISGCLQCPLGYSCGEDATPRRCPKGTVNSGGGTTCLTCDPGYYNDKEGGKLIYYNYLSYTECRPCPKGYYCPSPSESPIICPKGHVNARNGTVCIKCDNGYYSNKEGGRLVHHYSGYVSFSECFRCPNGHISSEDRTHCIAQG